MRNGNGFFGDDERGPTTGWPYRISRPRGRFANFVREHEISGRSGSVWLAVIFAAIAFVLFGLMLFGCAQTHAPAKAPSTAVVRSDFQAVKQHAVQTSSSIEAAKQNAAQLQDLGQRSSDKNVIMRRWLEWKQRQP
jgi:hypothetical protein